MLTHIFRSGRWIELLVIFSLTDGKEGRREGRKRRFALQWTEPNSHILIGTWWIGVAKGSHATEGTRQGLAGKYISEQWHFWVHFVTAIHTMKRSRHQKVAWSVENSIKITRLLRNPGQFRWWQQLQNGVVSASGRADESGFRQRGKLQNRRLRPCGTEKTNMPSAQRWAYFEKNDLDQRSRSFKNRLQI